MLASRVLLLAAPCLLAVAVATACQSQGVDPAHDEVHIRAPAAGATTAEARPGLHNVVAYADGMFSGGQPEGEEGLRSLAAMGVRTVVSVDGGAPDVATAEKLGLRYVHLPISYDTVTPERQRQLAQALATLPGPVYMHCHHGKHRSAAALGSAMVLCGKLTPDEAQERMGVSGTAKDYKGLWQAVRDARPLAAEELRVDPASFPSVTKVSGMVGTMAEIDMVIDLVKQASEAGWKPPADHPDLVPTKETARLASLFANLRQDHESLAYPAEYQVLLDKSIAASAALDAAVRANDGAGAATHLAAVTKGCKECHVPYRDR